MIPAGCERSRTNQKSGDYTQQRHSISICEFIHHIAPYRTEYTITHSTDGTNHDKEMVISNKGLTECLPVAGHKRCSETHQQECCPNLPELDCLHGLGRLVRMIHHCSASDYNVSTTRCRLHLGLQITRSITSTLDYQ